MASPVPTDSKEHHHVNRHELNMHRQRVRWVGHSRANFDAENAVECFPTPRVVSVRSVVFDDDGFFFITNSKITRRVPTITCHENNVRAPASRCWEKMIVSECARVRASAYSNESRKSSTCVFKRRFILIRKEEGNRLCCLLCCQKERLREESEASSHRRREPRRHLVFQIKFIPAGKDKVRPV